TQHVYVQVQAPVKKRVAIRANETPKHKGRGWLIRPMEELPQDTSAAVWVEPGIVSTQGREPGGEQRAVYAFDTLPPLRVLGLSCVSNAGQTTTGPAFSKRPLQQQCDPQRLTLLFSAPVLKEGAQPALRWTPALPGAGTDHDPWESVSNASGLARP